MDLLAVGIFKCEDFRGNDTQKVVVLVREILPIAGATNDEWTHLMIPRC